jgi:mRNA-degrading endonuclease RelE of RelBE toxin-antitoxin system
VARRYKIEIAPTGYRSLQAIQDKKIVREIARVIDGLERGPDEQGKALVAPLDGIRSVRGAQGRFRILYNVDARKRVVSVLLVGVRAPGRDADVYELARRLLETFGTRGKETRRS